MSRIFTKAELSTLKLLIGHSVQIGHDATALMEMAGELAKRQVIRNIDQQRDPITGKNWPGRKRVSLLSRKDGGGKALYDTGRLAKSIVSSPVIVTSNSAEIGSNLPYAPIHQNGGTITAKKSKYLAIPVSLIAKRAGSARRFIEQAKRRNEDPTFLRGRGGTLVIVHYTGRKWKSNGRGRRRTMESPGEMKIAFILKRAVKIPQRRFFGIGQREQVELIELTFDYFTKEFRKIKK